MTPTKVRNRSLGKPAKMVAGVMSIITEPTIKTAANASAPMLMGNTLAMPKMTTSTKIDRISLLISI
ncbi:hypothetical protein D9M73_218400 [compost metagenome]